MGKGSTGAGLDAISGRYGGVIIANAPHGLAVRVLHVDPFADIPESPPLNPMPVETIRLVAEGRPPLSHAGGIVPGGGRGEGRWRFRTFGPCARR